MLELDVSIQRVPVFEHAAANRAPGERDGRVKRVINKLGFEAISPIDRGQLSID